MVEALWDKFISMYPFKKPPFDALGTCTCALALATLVFYSNLIEPSLPA